MKRYSTAGAQLRAWINERRTAEQTRRRLEEKATEWVRLGRGSTGLLGGVALAEAETWLRAPDAKELGASQELVDLVSKSQSARRMRRIVAIGLALLLVGLLVGGALFQRQNATQARQSADAANQLRLEAETARNAALQSAKAAQQAQDLAETRLKEAERQSNINRAQTIRVQSQLMLNRNAECSLALALEAYDTASQITNFTTYPFQDSVRSAMQASHTEQVLPAPNGLHAVAWSHDERTVAAGMEPGGTQIWEVESGNFQEASLIAEPGWVGALAFSPDDRLLAIGGTHIALWNRTTTIITGTLRGSNEEIRVLAWHPNGRYLAAGSDDGLITVWDTVEQKVVQTLTEHQRNDGIDNIYGLSWNSDGTRLASAGWESIRIWDASTLQEGAASEQEGVASDNFLRLQATWDLNDHGSPLRIAWSPDDTRLVASFIGGALLVWDTSDIANFVDDQEPLQTIEAHTGAVWGLAWSADSRQLASSAEDQRIHIWTGQPLKLLTTLSGHTDSVAGGIAWNADGTALISAARDKSVRVWRLTPGGEAIQQINGYLLDAVWHPTKQIVALSVAIADGYDAGIQVWIWDLQNDKLSKIIMEHSSTVLRLQWSPDGKRLATASADKEVHMYDAQSGKRVDTLPAYTGTVNDLAWSPDGQRIAYGGSNDFSIRLYQSNDGSSERFAASNFLISIVWQPSGRYIAAGASNNVIDVWNVDTGQRSDWAGHDAAVSAVAWQPEGKWLASGGQDGQIIIWDTTSDDWLTGDIWKQGLDLGEQIWDLAWYGNLLAAAGVNGSVKVWDVMTGINVANYGGHIGAVRAVDWSADGRYIVTAGMTDGTAVVHYANFVDDLLPLAQRHWNRAAELSTKHAVWRTANSTLRNCSLLYKCALAST
ncbi:MAG: WD40 repeat domain-containing protein [Caldilineaceae bacterium]